MDIIQVLAQELDKLPQNMYFFICIDVTAWVIVGEKRQAVIDALKNAGYKDLEILDDGEWTAIASIRP